jgi:hypothetical protein
MDWLYLIWIFVKAFVLAYWYWCFIIGLGFIMVVWWVSGTHRNTPSEPKEQQQYMVASLLLIAGLLVAILVALIKIGNKL